eukprot:TRINITY_DN1772_c0_g12_i1.p1 TRINITY_DN1772_c0_g12~~TRINITY_DN1772_c0_g12_i1.p1  ORF type:complete len:151 (+),score=23.57 TRINITY_DN1772_c0_g12_i1:217-669(+)
MNKHYYQYYDHYNYPYGENYNHMNYNNPEKKRSKQKKRYNNSNKNAWIQNSLTSSSDEEHRKYIQKQIYTSNNQPSDNDFIKLVANGEIIFEDQIQNISNKNKSQQKYYSDEETHIQDNNNVSALNVKCMMANFCQPPNPCKLQPPNFRK